MLAPLSVRSVHTCPHDSTGISWTTIHVCWRWRAAENLTDDISLNAVPIDLSSDFAVALDSTKDLITISALLDLVSEDWLDRFARHVASHALPVYAALTYDGRIDMSPSDPLDEAITSAVNSHQRTDKGFGPALGPRPPLRPSPDSRRSDIRSCTAIPIG